MPQFTVTRSIVINAPVQQVFEEVRNFKQWSKWSPWLISEPDCRVKYGGDGKSYSWRGEIVGEGEMQILEEEPSRGIWYQLTFVKPWKSIAKVRFSFAEQNGGTKTTWVMEGGLPFFMFWMTAMMKAFIGMDYERGLSMLKDHIETGSVPSKLEFIGEQPSPGFEYIGIKNSCSIKEIAQYMEKDFKELENWAKESVEDPSGPPFSIYHKWDAVKGITEYTIGFPVKNVPATLPNNFIFGEREECRVFSIKHTGAYRHLGNAWSAGYMRAQSKIFKQNKRIHPFETYENNPKEVEENELVTIIHFPIK